MKTKFSLSFSLFLIVSIILSSCSSINPASLLSGKTVTVSIVYGSEKREWLEPLVKQFNDTRNKTSDDSTIVIEATAMGSIESVNAIISGELKPTVWSPASSIYIPVANTEWRKTNSNDLVMGNPPDLVVSPVVIAMWKPMAEALGWPNKSLGWADIAKLATSTEGWATYGFPEWGNFKFGHTHPNYSNSGVTSIIAETYAGLNKQRGLTIEDLKNPALAPFLINVESSIIHYGTSTGFFGDRMFERGPSYLSASVLYENLIVAQETKRLSGQSSQIPVVAIYPKEGTFFSNHPYAILNAPWVTNTQKEGAQQFQTFLLDKPQQLAAMQLGFRPADPSIKFTSPLDAQHGVDTNQPQTVLEVPSAEVISGIQGLWKQTKKPVDLVVVMDTSGSMAGEKIAAARQSMLRFISLLDNRDQLQVVTFNTNMTTMSRLSPLGEKRDDLNRRVSGIIEGGGTRLYGTISDAYADLRKNGNPKHIRAIVVLTDGQDTDSGRKTIDQLISEINIGNEGGESIKVFTIAFGKDADTNILKRIAEATGAKQYSGDPKDIDKVYADIATFF